jgi:hypothetical protein
MAKISMSVSVFAMANIAWIEECSYHVNSVYMLRACSMCLSMYVCIPAIYWHAAAGKYMHVYIYIYIYIHTYIYSMPIYIHTHIYIYACSTMSIYTYVCIYISIYIYACSSMPIYGGKMVRMSMRVSVFRICIDTDSAA